MDSGTVHYLSRHLISCQIDVFLFHAEIVPHNILCLEQIFIFQIFNCQSHSRKVVTIHNKDHVFRIICKCICQFFYKIIHLMDFITVVFPLIILCFGSCTGNGDLRIIDQLFFRISTMSLRGNRINIIRSIRRIQTFKNLICQNFILCPAKRVLIFFLRHIFCRSKSIKSKIRENTPSSIEIGFIVMYRMCGITQIFQYIRCTFASRFFQNTLIWILTRSEIMQTHTGD